MCKRAGFKYYNGYGSLNISELHGQLLVLFCTVCRNRFVETDSIKPQRYSRVPSVSNPSNSSIYDITQLFYSVVSSALERQLLVAARVRKELQSCTVSADININIMDFELLTSFLATIMSIISYTLLHLVQMLATQLSYIAIQQLHLHRGISTRSAFIMARCACASEVYIRQCVCVCVCVHVCRLLQLLKINEVQVRVSIG